MQADEVACSPRRRGILEAVEAESRQYPPQQVHAASSSSSASSSPSHGNNIRGAATCIFSRRYANKPSLRRLRIKSTTTADARAARPLSSRSVSTHAELFSPGPDARSRQHRPSAGTTGEANRALLSWCARVLSTLSAASSVFSCSSSSSSSSTSSRSAEARASIREEQPMRAKWSRSVQSHRTPSNPHSPPLPEIVRDSFLSKH